MDGTFGMWPRGYTGSFSKSGCKQGVSVKQVFFGIVVDFRTFYIVKYGHPVVLLNHTVGVIRICSLVFVNSSAQDASIFKISVAIFKRRSWGFQNTPNLWDLEHFKPSYGHLKKIEVSKNNFDWQFCSKYKQILNYLKTSLFSNCHNLAQNHPNFTSWGCFGILRNSSWRWPQRFWT